MDVHSLDYRAHAAAIISGQPSVRDAVTGATVHFDGHRARAYAEIDSDGWRTWAESVKSHVLTHLDRYLADAERSLVANGATVHWASTAADALTIVRSIAEKHAVKRVVKGKSMLSEELGVNPLMESMGIEVFETDLGEYIIQLLGEPPSHILGPAIHRSLEDIRQLFHERFGTPSDASPELLAERARRLLREAFVTADMGMTGGNFVVAETGTVALIENEGNIRLSTSVPRVHVALVGIEKLLPRWTDLGPFLQLTARAATGQPVGTFVSLIQGPRTFESEASDAVDAGSRGAGEAGGGRTARGVESDGPEEVHVVFVDNGRSRVLADPRVWEALRCVRCGACLNVCPVYRQTGGHAYGWVYSGPIGAVLNPGLIGLENTHPLPFASSLCGACYDVCPVRINIPALLLEWRERAVAQGLTPPTETRMMRTFATLATRPTAFRAAGRAFRAIPQRLRDALPVLEDWTSVRDGIRPDGAFHRLPRRDRSLPILADSAESEEHVADGVRAVAIDSAQHAGLASHSETTGANAGEPAPGVMSAGHARSSSASQVDGGDGPDNGPSDVGAGMPASTGGRRAFAGGTLGRTARAATHLLADGTENGVLRDVMSALEGRTRVAHPGPFRAQSPAASVGVVEGSAGEGETADHSTPGDGGPALRGAGDPTTVERFMTRFRANGGEVVRFGSAAEASEWVGRLKAEFDSCDVGVFVPEHLSPSVAGLTAAAAEHAALGVSSAVSAAADTGTLVLDSRDGRRTQLLPPVHLVWVREPTIHAALNDAIEELAGRLPAAIGLHSGPSRSADIGRVLVTGVHGPGRVIAAIVP